MSLINKLKNNAKKALVIGSLAVLPFVSSCSIEDIISQYETNTKQGEILVKPRPPQENAYEVVNEFNTLEDAQGFINDHIAYAYQDLENKNYEHVLEERKPLPANKAEIQSFETTFNRGGGVCRDGGIAINAMLQDNKDKYKCYVVHIDLRDNQDHMVCIVKDLSTNLYGSGGINKEDFNKPVYENLEDIIEKIGDIYDTPDINNRYYKLYDFEKIDLIRGTNDGLVLDEPFKVLEKRYRDENGKIVSYELKGELNKTLTGYLNNYEGYSYDKINHKKYAYDFSLEYFENGEILNEYNKDGTLSSMSFYNKTNNKLEKSEYLDPNDPFRKIIYEDSDYDGYFDILEDNNGSSQISTQYNKEDYPPYLKSDLEKIIE
jgi:hypothetical protein